MKDSAKDERKLIEKAKKDSRYFGPIYKKYKEAIDRYFYNRISTKEDFEDLTSLVFQKALSGLNSFRWQGVSFSSWLYKIAKNTLIDYYRKTAREKGNISIENVENVIATTKHSDNIAETIEIENLIKENLAKLDDRARKIIYMKFYEGYTNKAIAKNLGLSETNVGTIVHRALKKVRATIWS